MCVLIAKSALSIPAEADCSVTWLSTLSDVVGTSGEAGTHRNDKDTHELGTTQRASQRSTVKKFRISPSEKGRQTDH